MYICDTVSSQGSFEETRNVTEMDEIAPGKSQNISPVAISAITKSMMSKISDGKVEISGGVDSSGESWVEGKISFKFGDESKIEENNEQENDNSASEEKKVEAFCVDWPAARSNRISSLFLKRKAFFEVDC